MSTETSSRKIDPVKYPVKYLTAHFEGYFMCRIATDPDPTNETRGMSGYTMALSTEKNLDQVIRLHVEENFLKQNLRPPAKEMKLEEKLIEGVQVRSVTFDGKPWDKEHVLKNAKVCLLGFNNGSDGNGSDGPTFESRNNITGSDDTMSFVIDPFHLKISMGEIVIEAKDVLNPANPEQKIWQILDPKIYGRRLTSSVEVNSKEVAQAINVFDLYGYFYDRRRFLRSEIERLEKEKPEDYKTKIEQFKSRLYQLEFWGDRIVSKLGTKVSWSFEVKNLKDLQNLTVKGETCLGGTIDTQQPWPVQFWFGGWDGDLLVGYMRGSLSMPFTPDDNEKP